MGEVTRHGARGARPPRWMKKRCARRRFSGASRNAKLLKRRSLVAGIFRRIWGKPGGPCRNSSELHRDSRPGDVPVGAVRRWTKAALRRSSVSHLQRAALVYLRQSTPSQVEHNRESTKPCGWTGPAVRSRANPLHKPRRRGRNAGLLEFGSNDGSFREAGFWRGLIEPRGQAARSQVFPLVRAF